MAAVTPISGTVKRGVRGHHRTFRCQYSHDTAATQAVDTGLTNIRTYRVFNTETGDNNFTAAVSGGTITFDADSFTDNDNIEVYAEGW